MVETRIAQLKKRARRPRPQFPAAFLSLGRVVHARRPGLDGGAVLSRASAARAAREGADARGRRRRARVVHAHPAPRSRPRHRQRLQAAAAPAAPPAVRQLVAAVPGVLRAAPVQQELRAASRSVVRAEPSRRRLRRNVCGVADAGIELEDALRGLAGDQEARIHGRADAVAASARSRCSTDIEEVDPLRRLHRTLRHHYKHKRRHYGVDHPNFYDRDLRKLFSDAPEHAGQHDRGAVPRPRTAARSASSSPTGPASTSTPSTRCSKTSSSAAGS